MSLTFSFYFICLLSIFCNKCGSLGYVNNKGKVECDKCNSHTECVDVVTETGVIKTGNIKSKTVANDLSRMSTSTNNNKLKLGFIKELNCIFCSEEMVTSELRQMDQSDEPEVRFLFCHNCNKTWRD